MPSYEQTEQSKINKRSGIMALSGLVIGGLGILIAKKTEGNWFNAGVVMAIVGFSLLGTASISWWGESKDANEVE